MSFFKKHLRRLAVFAIFQLKAEQRMGGLIMSVKQNNCFWKMFFQQKKCTEWVFQILILITIRLKRF